LALSLFRSHLKKVFSSDIGVEPSYQVLDILEYACGLILGLALISNENPNFEMTSTQIERFSSLPHIQGRCRFAIVDYAERHLTQ
jgi:hypothetical protein